MPRGKHRIGLIGGMVIVLALSACASPQPSAPTSSAVPVATPSPAFTSDADAVAAATAFMRKYLLESNRVEESASASPNVLRVYLSSSVYKAEADGIAHQRALGQRLAGPLVLRTVKAQRIDRSAGDVDAYLCLDTRQARVIDSHGKDVTPAGRADGVTLLVGFANLSAHPEVTSSEQWSGSSVC